MITFALTTFNRYQSTIDSFSQILGNPSISDYIVLDDHSTDGSYEKLKEYFGEKVRVIRQLQNRGMSRNKHDAIAFASSEFVIIFDSDNVIDNSYVDSIPQELKRDTIYSPCFARPQFDYRKYRGLVFDKDNIKPYLNEPEMGCLLNTCNYVVPRDEYCRVYYENPDVKGADTIWFNYLWLRAGNKIQVCDMEYEHSVHDGSTFLKDVNYNLTHAEQIKQMIYES